MTRTPEQIVADLKELRPFTRRISGVWAILDNTIDFIEQQQACITELEAEVVKWKDGWNTQVTLLRDANVSITEYEVMIEIAAAALWHRGQTGIKVPIAILEAYREAKAAATS